MIRGRMESLIPWFTSSPTLLHVVLLVASARKGDRNDDRAKWHVHFMLLSPHKVPSPRKVERMSTSLDIYSDGVAKGCALVTVMSVQITGT